VPIGYAVLAPTSTKLVLSGQVSGTLPLRRRAEKQTHSSLALLCQGKMPSLPPRPRPCARIRKEHRKDHLPIILFT
jgi:hypothetical protein